MRDCNQSRVAVRDDGVRDTLEQRQIVDRIAIADRDRVVPGAPARRQPLADLAYLAILIRVCADIAAVN